MSYEPRKGNMVGRWAGLPVVLFFVWALAGLALLLPPAKAEVGVGAAIGGVGESQASSIQATVKDIDLSTRTATLVGANGDTVKVKVSDEVRNLNQVQPGDKVVVRFYDSVAYVIAPGGHNAPDDMAAVGTARAAPGTLPGAAVAERIIVTGVVVGVDSAANTISLVDPAGGKVRTLNVRDEQNRSMLDLVKVGDTVTAYLTEAVAVAVEPMR